MLFVNIVNITFDLFWKIGVCVCVWGGGGGGGGEGGVTNQGLVWMLILLIPLSVLQSSQAITMGHYVG